jgi:molybdopterin molybdotransferase
VKTSISYDEARELACAAATPVATERVALGKALGRIAARDMCAPFDLPGFPNSAMDGYAVRGADLPAGPDAGDDAETAFVLRGQLLAGDAPPHPLGPGQAVAIMTGAMMPPGADTVVIRENARVDGDRVWLRAGTRAGANVRAHDDDVAAGEPVLAAGERLSPERLGVLAAFGLRELQVHRRVRAAVLTTGDELVAAGQPLPPGRRYDSNGMLLSALLEAAGAQLVACETCGDDPARLRDVLQRLCAQADLVLTSGGVSAGVADHVPQVVSGLGSIVFWKVRMKPGMPVLCARAGNSLLFGLPGNPVSAGVVFRTLVEPALAVLAGARGEPRADCIAALAEPWPKTHGRLEFLRVHLHPGEGGWLATPLAHQGSGALSRLAQADALAVLPEGARDYAAGEPVRIIRL